MIHDILAARDTVILQILEERTAQDSKWGGPDRDDEHTRRQWIGFIEDHAKRARKATPLANARRGDLAEYRQQLVEIAAIAVAAIEAHDRDLKREPEVDA